MPSSINQNAYSSALPNFRNLGILLRILLVVNLVAIAAAMVASKGPHDFWSRLLDVSIVVQPLLLASMLALVAFNDVLKRLPYYLGAGAVLALELVLVTLLYAYGRPMLQIEGAWLERYWTLTLLVTLMLLLYFELRGRALSPAISE